MSETSGPKFMNFWRDGIPVELGEPMPGMIILEAVSPERCEGGILMLADQQSHTVYEVIRKGEGVERFEVGDIVLPVFEALRLAGEHLICREDEITVRWKPEQLYAPQNHEAA